MKITPLEIRQKSFEKVFRGYDKDEVVAFLQILSAEWEKSIDEKKELTYKLEAAEKEISSAFDKAKRCLTDAGFKSEQISTKVISDAYSRAEAIVKEARDGDYGTIVLGRRGLSKVKEFFMGRVSKKVIQTIRNRAVWVVT